MSAKVGINGFGRIGRQILRENLRRGGVGRSKIQIVGINDPGQKPDQMTYLFKYDSTYGRFKGDVHHSEKSIMIDGQKIDVYHEKEPTKIPWANNCVEYVIEASGRYTTKEKAGLHARDTVKHVIISAPSKDAPMFVMGINHECYNPKMKVVSNASCTTNGLAPLIKVVHDNFGVKEALMSTIHATTLSQKTLDGVSKKPRSGRSILNNIIPASTGAAKAIGRIIPDLNGKISGMAFRVPTNTVSIIDLTCRVNKECKIDSIVGKMREAADSYLKGILACTDSPVVTSDFIGNRRSCTFDSKSTMVIKKRLLKVIGFYDNEYGYACRVLDLLKYMISQEGLGK